MLPARPAAAAESFQQNPSWACEPPAPICSAGSGAPRPFRSVRLPSPRHSPAHGSLPSVRGQVPQPGPARVQRWNRGCSADGAPHMRRARPPAPRLPTRSRCPGWQRSGAFRGNSWPLPPASPSSPGTVRTALPGRTGGREGEGRPRAQGWTEKGAQRRQLPPAALRGRQHPSGDQNNAGTAGLPAPLPARGASSHPRTPPQPPPAARGRGHPAYLSRPSPVPAAVTLVHPPRLRDSRGAAQPCPAQRRTRRPAPRWLRTAPASCRPRAGAAHPGPASCCRGGRGAREDDGACGLKRAGYRTSAQPFLHMQGPACPPCLRRSPPCHLCCR